MQICINIYINSEIVQLNVFFLQMDIDDEEFLGISLHLTQDEQEKNNASEDAAEENHASQQRHTAEAQRNC